MFINRRNTMNNRNLTMLVDFYEITMANGFFENGFLPAAPKLREGESPKGFLIPDP